MNTTLNATLVPFFNQALTRNAAAPRYAKLPFNQLVATTLTSGYFLRAAKSVELLFTEEKELLTDVPTKRDPGRPPKALSVMNLATQGLNADGTPKRKRGRPKGSKNKPKVATADPAIQQIVNTPVTAQSTEQPAELVATT